MAKMVFPLVGGSYMSRSMNLDSQRCVNLFPVMSGSGTAKAVSALFGVPGKRLLATLGGTGAIRAAYRPTTGDAIVVRGSSVYRLTTAWVATFAGSIDTGTDPVSIDDDGTRAVIVTGPNGYTLDLATNVVTQITDPAFYGADYVFYNKTVFIFNRPGTAQFYITTGNGVTFDALDFAETTSNAEPIVRHVVNHEALFFFKTTVTEIWRAVGSGDFLFALDTNAAIEKGCQAKHSVVVMDSTVYWLGGDAEGDGIVWKMNGYSPERVSHDGVEYAIQNYAVTSDAEAFTYQQEGHTFYALSFPTANATWCYDVATGMWHERAYLKPSTGTLQRDRARAHMFYGGQHVVGDWENGNLYALDLGYYSDNGEPLLALRSCPHISGTAFNEIKFQEIRIDVEAGVGLTTGQGVDPQMMLRWSNDGGHTWSALKQIALGRRGEYARRARCTRLGSGRDRVFEISISDPVKRVILGAAVDAVDTGR